MLSDFHPTSVETKPTNGTRLLLVSYTNSHLSIVNYLQFFSSIPSMQSFSPSQRQPGKMHFPSLQVRLIDGHVAEIEKNGFNAVYVS